MAGAKGIEGRLVPAGESAQTTISADGGELVAPTCDDFMGIRLMPHIPHQLVVRGVKNVVQGKGELYSAETRGKVSRVLGKGVYDKVPQFYCQLLKVGSGKRAEVFNRVDTV